MLLSMQFTTCITPADIDPIAPENILVVDGFITDQPGPHQIRIERVLSFAGVLDGGVTQLEENAVVRVIDDAGGSIQLQRNTEIVKTITRADATLQPRTAPCIPMVNFREALTPSYRTPEGFRGEIGRTYTLEITTADGEVYRSEPQLMRETPVIDSLTLEFTILPSLGSAPASGVRVFSTFQDPVGEDYYFWKVNGIYRINTEDDRERQTVIPGAGRCCLFDPVDDGLDDCWILESDIMGNEIALSDRFFDGQRQTQLIGLVEDDGLRFANESVADAQQYYVEVEQYSMSREAFLFNERIASLQEIDGEIFDPPPLSIRGNVFNVENTDEPVVGFFGAYSVTVASGFISRDILEFRQPFPNPCGDCRVRAGAQVETPEPYR